MTLAEMTESLSVEYFNDKYEVARLLRTFLDKHNYTVVKPEPSVVYNETAVRFINGN